MNLPFRERKIFEKYNTPIKIQNFLDTLKANFELKGETCSSPRFTLKRGSAHCIEAAFLAAAMLKYHSHPPLLLDLKASRHDFDHVVVLFKVRGLWGAISKSNHVVLRFRDPVYKTVRELAMSYFHEYTDDLGRKTLRSFSKPFNLNQFDDAWITADFDLWDIAEHLNKTKHYPVASLLTLKNLRKADKMEILAGKITEWKKPR